MFVRSNFTQAFGHLTLWPFVQVVCFVGMSGGYDQERAAKVPATEDSVVAKAAGNTWAELICCVGRDMC